MTLLGGPFGIVFAYTRDSDFWWGEQNVSRRSESKMLCLFSKKVRIITYVMLIFAREVWTIVCSLHAWLHACSLADTYSGHKTSLQRWHFVENGCTYTDIHVYPLKIVFYGQFDGKLSHLNCMQGHLLAWSLIYRVRYK